MQRKNPTRLILAKERVCTNVSSCDCIEFVWYQNQWFPFVLGKPYIIVFIYAMCI